MEYLYARTGASGESVSPQQFQTLLTFMWYSLSGGQQSLDADSGYRSRTDSSKLLVRYLIFRHLT
jgi:hypothetical protein